MYSFKAWFLCVLSPGQVRADLGRATGGRASGAELVTISGDGGPGDGGQRSAELIRQGLRGPLVLSVCPGLQSGPLALVPISGRASGRGGRGDDLRQAGGARAELIRAELSSAGRG